MQESKIPTEEAHYIPCGIKAFTKIKFYRNILWIHLLQVYSILDNLA